MLRRQSFQDPRDFDDPPQDYLSHSSKAEHNPHMQESHAPIAPVNHAIGSPQNGRCRWIANFQQWIALWYAITVQKSNCYIRVVPGQPLNPFVTNTFGQDDSLQPLTIPALPTQAPHTLATYPPVLATSPNASSHPDTSFASSTEEAKVGYVLLSPSVFKCIHASCASSTFSRLADLRRHHSQLHSKEKQEYFCSFVGCRRHKDGALKKGGKVGRPKERTKGKSFGVRKDKRDEHVRTVHRVEGS